MQIPVTAGVPPQPRLHPEPAVASAPTASASSSSARPDKSGKSIFSKAKRSSSQDAAGSFRVEDEASPYAFTPEKQEPQQPFRKTASGKSVQTKQVL